jgi:hypothetical protein
LGTSQKEVRRSRIVSLIGINGSEHASSSLPQDCIFPVEGILDMNTAQLVISFTGGESIVLDIENGRIFVLYGTVVIGWLGDGASAFYDRIIHGQYSSCRLYDAGGTLDKPFANVIVRL